MRILPAASRSTGFHPVRTAAIRAAEPAARISSVTAGELRKPPAWRARGAEINRASTHRPWADGGGIADAARSRREESDDRATGLGANDSGYDAHRGPSGLAQCGQRQPANPSSSQRAPRSLKQWITCHELSPDAYFLSL